jgi:hypothetical protein
MQTEQIVSLLVAERNRLDAAIHALQGSEKRPARAAGSGLKKAAAPTTDHTAPVKPRAVVWDAAKKKAQAERMKAFWAAKRKNATGSTTNHNEPKVANKPASAKRPAHRKRTISPEAKARMAAGQQRRWAAVKSASRVVAKKGKKEAKA